MSIFQSGPWNKPENERVRAFRKLLIDDEGEAKRQITAAMESDQSDLVVELFLGALDGPLDETDPPTKKILLSWRETDFGLRLSSFVLSKIGSGQK